MSLTTMYPAKINSPATQLTNAINDSVTSIEVDNASALPDAPNLATINRGDNAETIRYTAKTGNILTVERAFQGTAQSWGAGTQVVRNYTAYDHDSFRVNVEENHNKIVAHLADYADKFYNNAGAHNSIYRGKYLGGALTSAQQTAIQSGTFEDLYIGDYWTIGGINYRIAGFNYFRNVGDIALTVNHVTIVPDTVLYNAQMNATNITTGGYVGSGMRTTSLASAITTIESAFLGRVVSHRQLLTNATVDGKASGWAWFDSKVELMNEVMVYGSGAWGVSSFGNGYNVASGHGRLPLFALRQDMVNTRQTYWLRDVVSATHFASVFLNSSANHNSASNALGVRPAFSIS